jgi:predicted RNA-binding Zn-ribbon protein involved in translation (DUF1610 family)
VTSGNKALNMRKKVDTQSCPICDNEIGIVAGGKDAICTNCGFKDPCCE